MSLKNIYKILLDDTLIDKIIRKMTNKTLTEWGRRIERDNHRIAKVLTDLVGKNSNCVDIGAHKGGFLDLVLTNCPQGKHTAFEPIPDLGQNLKNNYKQVDVHSCAVGNENGTLEFFIPNQSKAMSGFKRQEYPDGADVEKVFVQVKKLDDVINQQIDLIKIDVEGAEKLVLEGAQDIISKNQPVIIFEYAILHAREFDVKPENIFKVFEGMGYGIWRLDMEHSYKLDEFVEICNHSLKSDYDRNAETNFIAKPV